MVCWPLVPGATSYNLLRSTSRNGQYAPVADGVRRPRQRKRAESGGVCGRDRHQRHRVFLQGEVSEPRWSKRGVASQHWPRSRRPSSPAMCRPRRRTSKSSPRGTIRWPSRGRLRRERTSTVSGERRCMRTASAEAIPWAAFCSTTPSNLLHTPTLHPPTGATTATPSKR